MTMTEARAALDVPAHLRNVNTVQDGQYRLHEALKRAALFCGDIDPAPAYVELAVLGLQSWVEHAEAR